MNMENIEKIKGKIVKILRKNNVVRAGIFGSYARGEEKSGSDIDILVETSEPLGFAFAGLELELERRLKRKVDLLTYKGINPLLRERILREEIKNI